MTEFIDSPTNESPKSFLNNISLVLPSIAVD